MLKSIYDLKKNEYFVNIYGAGVRGKRLLDFFCLAGLKDRIKCFIVKSVGDNESEIDGIPVYSMDDERVDRLQAIIIISLADPEVRDAVFADLIKNGYHRVELLSGAFYEDYYYEQEKRLLSACDARIRIERFSYEEPGFCHILIPVNGEDVSRCYMWRFYYSMLRQEVLEGREYFTKNGLLEDFESCFGEYRLLSDELQQSDAAFGKAEDAVFKIYMTRCVVDRYEPKLEIPEWLIPIQVGAELTEKRFYPVTDNTGDQISNMNRDFSECTAIYWIWKNVHDADYVGLCHYSRFMDISGNDLPKIADMNIDIVLTTPMLVGSPIRDFFAPRYITSLDWTLMEEGVLRHFPEYKDTLEAYHRSCCYPGANITIMRKDIYDSYAEFIFTVMLEVAEYYRERDIVRNDRYAGYLVENLTALFAMHNKDKYKICFTDYLYVK